MRTKEQKNEYLRQWRKKNPDKVKAANKRKYQRDKKYHPERIERKKILRKKWLQKNKERRREYQRKWSKRKLEELKEKVFDKLGHKCSRCGFADKRALCIDHINGNGTKELRKLNVFIYYRKVLADTKNQYQILCQNCNWIKKAENNEVRKPQN